MHFRRLKFSSVGIMIVIINLSLLTGSIRAQQSEAAETFVYGVNAAIPGEVYASLSPPQIDEIYILANQVSMLSPRMTMLVYWPPSERYQARWSELNESLDGVLEILQGDRIVTTVSQTSYTVHYVVAGSTVGEIFVANDAADAELQFRESQATYLEEMANFRALRLQWLDEARTALIAGERLFLKPEPRRPESFTTLSVGIQQGYPVNLDVGEYKVRLRGRDGQILEGSERTLHVFESRQTNLGFDVIPEDLWTMPERVNDRSDAILGTRGTVIYLRPRLVHEYPAEAIERLRDPQFADEIEGNWSWIPDASQTEFPEEVLEIVRFGRVIEHVPYDAYSVRYDFNLAVGYEILPYDEATPNLTPRIDFSGFRVELPERSSSFMVRFGPEAEHSYDGSVRRVWALPEDMSLLLIPVAILLVVIVAGAIIMWRRRTQRRVDVDLSRDTLTPS